MTVAFEGTELWGADAHPADRVHVDSSSATWSRHEWVGASPQRRAAGAGERAPRAGRGAGDRHAGADRRAPRGPRDHRLAAQRGADGGARLERRGLPRPPARRRRGGGARDRGAPAAALPDIGLHAVANTPEVHNVVVCTLCSCYPLAWLGPPPGWYKSEAYRSRVVRDPRGVLAEFGTVLPDDVEVPSGTRAPRPGTWCCRRRPRGSDLERGRAARARHAGTA